MKLVNFLLLLAAVSFQTSLAVPVPEDIPLDAMNEKILAEKDANYLVLIDAGSSGSRVRVFRYGKKGDKQIVVPRYVNDKQWDYKLEERPLHKEVTVEGTALAPAEVTKLESYFQGLFDKAKDVVPEGKRANTYISLMATAGMRKLTKQQADAILKGVSDIIAKGPFKKTLPGRVAYILPGEDEGAYTWMTYNNIKNTLATPKTSTAIVEVGGASTQVVFALDKKPAKYAYPFKADGKDIPLYATSYMGFGNDEERSKLITGLRADGKTTNPCGVTGTSLEGMESKWSQAECEAAVKKYALKMDDACEQEPCAFAGRYMPPIPTDMKIAVVSTFERVREALNCGSGEKTDRAAPAPENAGTNNLKCIEDRINKVCAAPSKAEAEKVIKGFGNTGFKWHEKYSPSLCFQGKLAVGMLHDGLHIPKERALTFVDKKSINKAAGGGTKAGVQAKATIGWDYGAALSFVNQLNSK